MYQFTDFDLKDFARWWAKSHYPNLSRRDKESMTDRMYQELRRVFEAAKEPVSE